MKVLPFIANWASGLRIRTRLAIGFGGLLLLVLTLGTAGVGGMSRLEGRVTEIVAHNNAKLGQSAGVAQAGEAITQMDRATQQKAALVEQSAAAAESLHSQAKQLVGAVAVFKLIAEPLPA